MAKKQVSEVEQTDQIQNNNVEQKYPSELLAKSETLKSFGLHPDFIRAILVEPEYTIKEAQKLIQGYIDSFIM